MKKKVRILINAVRAFLTACRNIPLHRIIDYLQLYRSGLISPEEYLNFQMWKKSPQFRDSFLSYNLAMEYWSILNPTHNACLARDKYLTSILLDKTQIPHPKLYAYYNPEMSNYNDSIANNIKELSSILTLSKKKSFVIKPSADSAHGNGVLVCNDFNSELLTFKKYNGALIKLSDIIHDKRAYLFEEPVIQNVQMMKLNSSSVNTVRIMTALYPNQEVRLFAAWFKIGRAGSCIDNAGSGGNVDGGVNINTGELFNATKFDSWSHLKSVDSHPDSKAKINGLVLDNWSEIKRLVMDFQARIPELKTIGWDVALTEHGPMIIEINNWWDPTGQLFIGKGWKKEVQDCYNAWKDYYNKR